MKRASISVLILLCRLASSFAQTPADPATFKTALPAHPGQLAWRAEGFRIVETSAKAGGNEIGLRGRNDSGQLEFLGFLFLVPRETALTSSKCREQTLESGKPGSPNIKLIPESQRAGGPPVDLVEYSSTGRDGKTRHMVRGFVATVDICGDLEFYSTSRINSDDPGIKKIFDSYHLDPDYHANFLDVLLYAQILYQHRNYGAAAPVFDLALTKLPDDKSQQAMRRATTDQAGMAYGISGNIAKARAIFEAAVASDPDYPLYYYNLACADAEERKLDDARVHLRQAFERKANVVPGESMPDPKQDDSILPYKRNKEFWTFVESLH